MRRLIVHRWLVLLIGSTLIIPTTCSAPASRINKQKPKIFTLELAQKIADESTPVRFADDSKFFSDRTILGWTDEGFITLEGEHIDTLEYDNGHNRLMVRLDKRRTSDGAINGSLVGLGISALWLLIGLDTAHRHEGSDMAGLGLGVTIIYIIPITMIAITGIGALIGYSKHEYKRYSFNKDDFAENPWLSMRYYQNDAVNELHKQNDKIRR